MIEESSINVPPPPFKAEGRFGLKPDVYGSITPRLPHAAIAVAGDQSLGLIKN